MGVLSAALQKANHQQLPDSVSLPYGLEFFQAIASELAGMNFQSTTSERFLYNHKSPWLKVLEARKKGFVSVAMVQPLAPFPKLVISVGHQEDRRQFSVVTLKTNWRPDGKIYLDFFRPEDNKYAPYHSEAIDWTDRNTTLIERLASIIQQDGYIRKPAEQSRLRAAGLDIV